MVADRVVISTLITMNAAFLQEDSVMVLVDYIQA